MGSLWLAAVLLLPVLAVTAVFLVVWSKFRRNRAIGRTYPQPSGVPVLGHLLHMYKPREELFNLPREFRKQLGSRYVINWLCVPSFNISDPEAVEVVLSSSKHIAKGRVYGFLRPWLGQGLLTSTGRLWRSRRKLLTPAFHFRILGQFTHHLEEHAQRLADDLDAARSPSATPIDVVPIVSRVTLSAICVTAMGKVSFETNATGGVIGEDPYFDAIHRVGTAIVARMVRPWLWLWPIFKMSTLYKNFSQDLSTLHAFTSKVIAERKAELLADCVPASTVEETHTSSDDVHLGKKKQPRPFLDSLLDAQKDGADLSDEDIREEVDTFMFEGHDTTSTVLCWALELLGKHPDVQGRLASELAEQDSLDWESVSKLPYLDGVLKECLRLRPSVPVITRYLEDDAVLPDGKILPSYAMVNIHIYDLHRHPEHFPDPERFDPDRFLPEAEQDRHPFAYVPFSAGPRNCIGKRFATMELKLLLAAVVHRFDIRSAMMGKDEDMFIADLVLRPRSGVYLKLTPRI